MRLTWRSWFLTALLTVTLALPPAAAAAPAADAVLVRVNGAVLDFPDTRPVIRSGRALVPIRAIVEALGARVEWDAQARTATITLHKTVVKLTAGETTAQVDGRPVTLDVPADILGGRILVPLRFLAESLGARVGWDAATRTAAIALAPPLQADPQALALAEKFRSLTHLDFKNRLTLANRTGDVTIGVVVESEGSVRGTDALTRTTLQFAEGQSGHETWVAARGGQYWVKAQGAWMAVAHPGSQSGTADPLLKEFPFAGVQMGGTRTLAGTQVQEVVITYEAAVLNRLMAALSPFGDPDQAAIKSFRAVLFVTAAGEPAGMEITLQAAATAEGSETDLHLLMRCQETTAPIQWPPDLP